MSNINITISLTIKTCKCGGIYAVPYWLNNDEFECPLCAGREARRLRGAVDELHGKLKVESHRNNGLRGALTARKKVMR